ncbi:YraN family protein [Nocardioides sp. Iso805N]|uniref:YraN family protein n=1 Tax=Nocardioides sp. Iso805N TaxID=1283287 RepID=UPI000477643E|nr:YraN family protein [Nocardioides sp. Iso805N]
MTTTAASKQAMGRYGEAIAERHLTAQGLVVLERNWHCTEGEIDLVLREGDTLVICEVKTRSDDAFGTPQQAVTQAKLDRLHRLAERWITARGLRPAEVRVDLVAVHRPRRGAARVEHVRGLS